MKLLKLIIAVILAFLSLSSCGNIKAVQKSDDITLIYITDDTLDRIGSFPMTRDKFGEFINALYTLYNPACVFFDIIFSNSNRRTLDLDEAFFASIAGKKNIFFTSVLTNQEEQTDYNLYKNSELPHSGFNNYLEGASGLFPLPQIIANGAKFGFSNVVPSAEGYIDRFPTIIKLNNHFYYSSLLILTNSYLNLVNEPMRTGEGRLVIGSRALPVDDKGGMPVSFKHAFDDYEFFDIIDHKIPGDKIDGKMILVGVNYSGGMDFQATRVNLRMTGLEVTAHAVQTAIDALRND